MSRDRHLSAEIRTAIKLAERQRVEAVWACLGVLCPDLTPQAKKALAEKVFDLCRGGGSESAEDYDHLGAGDNHYLVKHAVH